MTSTYLELRDRPVFICGYPKSGTSLLSALLDSHPQLVVYPEETLFFRRYLPVAEGRSLDEQIRLAEKLLIHIFQWNQQDPPDHQAGYPDRDYSAIAYEQVAALLGQSLSDHDCRHPGDILYAAIRAYGEVSGQLTPQCTRWVEKSPYNERYAEAIFAWWPQARCIHIIRDPRDNYASYQRKKRHWSAEFFAHHWVGSTRKGFENRAAYGPENYWLLRYEDLVTAPEAFIEQLCGFLEIEAHPILAVPSRVGIPWEGNSMFDEQFEAISAKPVGRWRQALPPAEVAVIEHLARPLMDDLDYRRTSRRSLTTSLRLASWPLRRRLAALFGRREGEHR